MRALQRTMITSVAAIAATLVCGQWNFTVDPTFQTQITQQNVGSLLLNEDGTLIASGIMRFPSEFSDKRLVRLLPNGQRDESFYNSGLGGVKLTRWQDRFYVGTSGTVRRILPNGIQDPSFIEMNYGLYFSSLQGGDYHVYPDGRVLMSGNHNLSDSARGFVGHYQLIWFSNTGYLDTTRIHRRTNGVIWDFKELPDGKFICSCTCSQYEGQPVDRVFRVHADGALDTTFHSGVSTGSIHEFHAVPDGRVMIGGYYRRSIALQDTLRLARFMPDGSLDPTFTIPQFGGQGGAWLPSGTAVFDIFPFSEDRFIIAGQFTTVNGQSRKGICMIDSTGQLLPDFDGCGASPFTFQGVTNAGFTNVYWNVDSTALYVCGTYAGYNDGTTNDTQQRFVSRLLVAQLTTGLQESEQQIFSLYPNPTSRSATLELEQVPKDAVLVVRDALGREMQRRRVSGYYTTVDLQALNGGVYFVELWSTGSRQHTQRLVVEH